MDTIEVFVEHEAGTNVVNFYDEETFEHLGSRRFGPIRPFPYGFVPGTLAPDGDCADCFVLTDQPLTTGTRMTVEPIALMEQVEAGDVDHNVLVVVPGAPEPDLDEVRPVLEEFLHSFMTARGSDGNEVGDLLPREAAHEYLQSAIEAFEAGREEPS